MVLCEEVRVPDRPTFSAPVQYSNAHHPDALVFNGQHGDTTRCFWAAAAFDITTHTIFLNHLVVYASRGLSQCSLSSCPLSSCPDCLSLVPHVWHCLKSVLLTNQYRRSTTIPGPLRIEFFSLDDTHLSLTPCGVMIRAHFMSFLRRYTHYLYLDLANYDSYPDSSLLR